jgi:hypothetical protein
MVYEFAAVVVCQRAPVSHADTPLQLIGR